MRSKTLVLSLFVVAAMAQLGVPLSMIGQRELTLRSGERYKFKTAPVDPYDAFRGRYVALRLEEQNAAIPPGTPLASGKKAYVTVETGEDGFAKLRSLSAERPKGRSCIPVTVSYINGTNAVLQLPFDRYYLPEGKAPQAESAYREHSRGTNRTSYVTVRVLDGFAVLEELYIDDVPIKEFLKKESTK
jgi:uncharacterized membrane-anchored protein